jgi:aryl-alcohol dehydrogenase-like predicted oxidoreductase
MQHSALPNTELVVASLCLGTGEFGSKLDKAAAWRLLDEYVAAGGNFIDTANVYGDWVPGQKSSSEKVIGSWLAARQHRDRIILATKGGHPRLESMAVGRLSPDDIRFDVEQSLGHLQTDRIDLYWLHRDDPTRPVVEIVETLAALVQAGKLRAVGCSNWRVERLAAANAYAASAGLPGFTADQMLWNAAVLGPDAPADKTLVAMDGALYDYHAQTGLAAIPYSAQANGVLQKLVEGREADIRPGQRATYPLAANRIRAAAAQRLAQELGTTLTAVVLGYLQSRPFVTIPIIGPQTSAQLHDSLAGADLRLTPAQLAVLDAAR